MPRIGLVLGAGGVLGHAFHVGVLKALEEATGWDPRDADVIVGTSAGSHVAAYLRAGASASDLAARIAGDGAAMEDRGMYQRLGDPFPVPPPRPAFGLTAPRLLARGVTRPWATLPGAVLAASVPRGPRLPPRLRGPHQLAVPRPRLAGATAVAAGRRPPRGRLTVFGREGAPPADVGHGRGRLVRGARVVHAGGGRRGAVRRRWCPLRDQPRPAGVRGARPRRRVLADVDQRSAGPRLRLGARWSLRMRLGQEARTVRRHGTDVVAFQPTPADVAVMGWNAMNPARRREVVEQAYTSASHRLSRDSAMARLAPLTQVAAGG
jgi:NTE family protein